VANYWNKVSYEWLLNDDKMSYRIIVGKNINLPDGLENKFPTMLKLLPGIIPVIQVPETVPEKVESIKENDYSNLLEENNETLITKLTDELNIAIKEIEGSNKPKRSKTMLVKSLTKKYEEKIKEIKND